MKRLYIYIHFPIVVALLLTTSCSVSKRMKSPYTEVPPPENYCRSDEAGVAIESYWWEEFGSGELDAVVEHSLYENYTLKQSWWKIVEACAQYKIIGADLKPHVFSNFSIDRSKQPLLFGTPIPALLPDLPEDFHLTAYSHSFFLSYELDIWNRIRSEQQAACLEMLATREDLESTALLLSGTVVDAWLSLMEQHQQYALIQEQIEVSQKLLKLVEVRYGMGVAQAIDVTQQRLQLESVIENTFPIQSNIEVIENQLNVLLGGVPCDCRFHFPEEGIELPPFPDIGSPFDLLVNRPDLRAFQKRISAADYGVAAAIAARFPALSLMMDYTNFAQEIADLFKRSAWEIALNTLTPLFDGGKRRAEVLRRRAILCGLITAYTQAFLNALEEVESSLAEEKYQKALVEQIQKELDISARNLVQARRSYLNGLNDYLTVITAIQVKQNLERRLINEKINLLKIRSKLYRALGGVNWTTCNS